MAGAEPLSDRREMLEVFRSLGACTFSLPRSFASHHLFISRPGWAGIPVFFSYLPLFIIINYSHLGFISANVLHDSGKDVCGTSRFPAVSSTDSQSIIPTAVY